MNILIELTYILGFSFLGQTVSKTTGIPVPGSVIGLILFFLSLQFKIIKLEGVEKTSNFLTDNLAILFIPAGVAIISNFNKIKNIWVLLAIICFISTIISLIFVGRLTQHLIKRGEKNESNGTN